MKSTTLVRIALCSTTVQIQVMKSVLLLPKEGQNFSHRCTTSFSGFPSRPEGNLKPTNVASVGAISAEKTV